MRNLLSGIAIGVCAVTLWATLTKPNYEKEIERIWDSPIIPPDPPNWLSREIPINGADWAETKGVNSWPCGAGETETCRTPGGRDG